MNLAKVSERNLWRNNSQVKLFAQGSRNRFTHDEVHGSSELYTQLGVELIMTGASHNSSSSPEPPLWANHENSGMNPHHG